MPRITYVPFGAEPITVTVKVGDSVMNGARDNNIQGIEADCGGSCVCSTCHVYVDKGWIDRMLEKSDEEEATLEFTIDQDLERSRLSCQLLVTDEMDGLTVHLPEEQA